MRNGKGIGSLGLDVSLGAQQLGQQDRTAGGAPEGVVAQEIGRAHV